MKKYQLTADTKLNIFQKIIWFVINFYRNSFSRESIDPHLLVKKFKVNLSDSEILDMSSERTPARRLSDIFWRTLPKDLLNEELVGLKAIEVGCGKGTYGLEMKNIFSEKLIKYTGVDIFNFEQWKNFDDRMFTFHQASANDFARYLESSNFIITQSALEHFDNDLQYFQQIKKYVEDSCNPILQIHLMPSKECLRLYLLHGYRQYTISNISKLTKIFGKGHKRILFSLGGKACNNVHFNYWTKSMITKKPQNLTDYNRKFLEAVRKDNSDGDLSSTSFYALVMFHNTSNKLNDYFSEL